MLTIIADSLDDLYKRALHRIMAYGEFTYPRGFTCKEISPCCTILTNPQMNVLVNPLRKASRGFMAAEFLWMLMGRLDVGMISFYNSKISKFSDDGDTFFGAYGPKIITQLPYILNVLKKDPWTRQGIINIWRESPPQTKDVPCTISMQFIQRPLGKLNMYVTMRSQDIWLGFPYDVHNFTCIQMLISSILGIKPGVFVLNQGSLHAYNVNFKDIEEAVKWDGKGPETFTHSPIISSAAALKIQLDQIKEMDSIVRDNTYPWEAKTETLQKMLYELKDPLLCQKAQWLINHGAKKYASH